MNSFGLGLVLNFVDNASAGMRGAIDTLNQLQGAADQVTKSASGILMASYALDTVGSTMMNTGSAILGVFSAVSQSVINTGMTMQGYRMQLAALYGSTEAGEAMMEEIKQYAMSSVFDIQSLIPAVTMMKAVGIEAMEEVTTSSGKNTQRLLDYASDIAAMVPNMRNSYGTGVQAAMGAIKEYIAEGNALSLKRGAGLDITGILGEDKGASIEERTQQVADLVEMLNIVGYTADLAGTPTQRLSNLQDAWFNTLSKIADSGVFEAYCSLLERASNWVFALVENEETFNTVTEVLAETLTAILSPLETLLDIVMWLGEGLINIMKNNPVLARGILLMVAAFGSLLVVGGAVLKVLSAIGMASFGFSSIKSLLSVFNLLGVTLTGVLSKVFPLVAIAALLYMAWSTNLFGIRDLVTEVFGDVVTIIKLCADAWADNTLSEENFVKARELGILPLIESLMDLKYRLGFFFDGVKEGFQSVFDTISEILPKIAPVGSSVYEIAQNVGVFLKSLFGVQGTEDAWKSVGDAVGKVVAVLLIGIPVVTTVVKVIGAIVGVVKTVVTVVKAVFTAFSAVWSVVSTVVSAVAALLGVSVGWAAVIVAAVVAVVAAVIMYWDEIKAVLSTVGSWIYSNIITPVVNFVVDCINFIVGLVAIMWEGIVAIVSGIASWVNSNIITPIVNFVTSLWNSIVSIVTSIVENVTSIVTTLIGIISSILTAIWNALVVIFSPIASWVNSNVISPVVSFFSSLIGSISDIFNSVKSAITGAFQSALDTIKGIWGGVVDFFSGIASKVGGIFSGIASKGASITGWSGIPAAAEGVNNFVGGLIQVNEKGGELITLPSGSTVIPHDESIEESFRKGMALGARAMVPVTTPQTPTTVRNEQNDYSVTFSAGSIVIQLTNASDAELEKAAEKLMKIIERKQQLKKMAVRS